MNEARFESELEDVTDRVVNLIAGSGLPELAVVERLAERYAHTIEPLQTVDERGTRGVDYENMTGCTRHEAGACYEGCPDAYRL